MIRSNDRSRDRNVLSKRGNSVDAYASVVTSARKRVCSERQDTVGDTPPECTNGNELMFTGSNVPSNLCVEDGSNAVVDSATDGATASVDIRDDSSNQSSGESNAVVRQNLSLSQRGRMRNELLEYGMVTDMQSPSPSRSAPSSVAGDGITTNGSLSPVSPSQFNQYKLRISELTREKNMMASAAEALGEKCKRLEKTAMLMI